MKKLGKVFLVIAFIGALLGFVSMYLLDNWVLFCIAVGMFIVGAIGVMIFAKELKEWLWALLDIL
jgi:hypothetical protein